LLKKVRQEKTINKKPMNSECVIYLEKENIMKLKDILKDFKEVTKSKEIKEGNFKVEFF
jgi:hypothetical protein